ESFSPPQLSVLNATNDQQQTVQIFLQKQQRSIGVPVGQSILMALENEGIAHPSGCRMGLCNTCACGKISGTTQHLISGDQQHDADSALRVCVSTAQNDLILDI
ncbi:2Fe-2S iron-sulfur cluster-binding protein, partial [Rhizobium hidalgonense]